jgi:hypothetical protein
MSSAVICSTTFFLLFFMKFDSKLKWRLVVKMQPFPLGSKMFSTLGKTSEVGNMNRSANIPINLYSDDPATDFLLPARDR